MVRGSKRFTDLKHRLEELRDNLLSFLPPPPQSKTSFSPKELDLTSSYIVLVHAEIESFCEDLVKEKVTKAIGEFTRKKRVTPILRRMIVHYVVKSGKSWSDVRNPTPATVHSASQSHRETVSKNNGVKQSNLEKLLFPLGLTELASDATWLAQMDSFGTNRGSRAHRSTRALNPPDPATELANVNQMLEGLLKLDRMLSRLK
jgi:RiboL-PSP-HEPN